MSAWSVHGLTWTVPNHLQLPPGPSQLPRIPAPVGITLILIEMSLGR